MSSLLHTALHNHYTVLQLGQICHLVGGAPLVVLYSVVIFDFMLCPEAAGAGDGAWLMVGDAATLAEQAAVSNLMGFVGGKL